MCLSNNMHLHPVGEKKKFPLFLVSWHYSTEVKCALIQAVLETSDVTKGVTLLMPI